MASNNTDEYHYDKQTLLSEHELLLARTQNNTIDSSMQTTELQSSKLIELNSLKAIKISDLAPGNSYDNKLIYSTQITPVAVAEAVCFVIEDECGNVCRASVPCIVRTVHLVRGAKLAFSNPIYRMAFDGRYSLIVHNACNVSLLPLVVVQQKYEETYSDNLNSSMHRISTTNSNNSDNTNQEDSTNLDMNTEIETNQPTSLIPIESNEINLPSLQIKPVDSLNQQDQLRESNSDIASIYIGQSTRIVPTKVGFEISLIANKLFKEGRYLQAIIQYTRAIEANANDAMFYSNRALSYSKMGEYDNSLTDFLQANILDPDCFKYQYLVALTWSRIGNHKLSIDLLSKIKTKDSVNSQFVEKLMKEEKLFVKNIEGEFDFDKLKQTVAMSGENKIGDYIGSIRILDTPNHGRGIFASFNIIKGENICIVKAVEFFSGKADTCECKNCRMAVLRSNKQNKTLHPKIIESARKSKLTTVRLVSLCDRSIKNVNIELFSGCGHEFAKNFNSSNYPLDRILKLVNKNLNIELVPLDLAQQLRNVNEKASLSIPPSLKGIWLLPSFINHSCIPNAVKIFIGDICIVRAITDIPAGEEVLISYIPLRLFPNVHERTNFLGFKCDCNLCEFERKPDVRIIISKFIKLEDYLRPYVDGHITLADPYPYPVQQLLPISKEKKIPRKKWLVIESDVFELFAQIKSLQSVDLFSISFQNCIRYLIALSTTNEDTIQMLPKAEPFISLFEPETYLMFWFLFYSVMFVKEKFEPHDPLFDHVEKQYYDFQNLLK